MDTLAAAVPARKDLLSFLTCGSVDDGKSTLIGRLLYDSRLVFDDHLAALAKDSRKHGTTGADVDLALLLDGLEAEREQGITIDVAYRFFATARRTFIVADTPGHEQYTRNMATGASTADLAILLVDARAGLKPQTRRHASIVALIGIRHVVLAVNKIDLIGFDAATFRRIAAEFAALTDGLGFASATAIPVSARHGDNIARRSPRLAWHDGPTLLEHLETVEIGGDAAAGPFRLPVQWVNRPDSSFRGFAGTVAGGRVRPGDAVVVAASGRAARVSRIVTADGDRAVAEAGDAVTLVLDAEIDISRGDLLASPESRPAVADRLAAHLVWMAEAALAPGRAYLMKCGTRWVTASVTRVAHVLDVTTQRTNPAETLALNEIGAVELALAQPIAFDAYRDNRATGAFILVDRFTNATVAAGMIDGALGTANLTWQALDVTLAARERAKGQRAGVVWFTGLSGAGKSTIANIVERKLAAIGRHTFLLDGDNVRHGLNRDLGFGAADRAENIRRVAEVAKLMADAGLIVLVSFIAPFRAERDAARALLPDGRFVEVFVDTPLETCEARDAKGLYARARAGLVADFTGIDSPYEPPVAPEVRLTPADGDAEAQADRVLAHLRAAGLIEAGDLDPGL
jgi:bifunctional enzyme CysN/CysC